MAPGDQWYYLEGSEARGPVPSMRIAQMIKAGSLNKLTSTEKLEGFSLTTMFSEVFKARKRGEIEDYFVVGTSKTTPRLDKVETGWYAMTFRQIELRSYFAPFGHIAWTAIAAGAFRRVKGGDPFRFK